MKGHGVFPAAEEKQFLQGDVGVEGESPCSSSTMDYSLGAYHSPKLRVHYNGFFFLLSFNVTINW